MRSIHDAIKEYSKDSELVIGVPGECEDSYFDPSGCEIVDTLATNITDVDCLLVTRDAQGNIVESFEFRAGVCHEVLDAYHNGTNYWQNERGDWIAEWDLTKEQLKKLTA